MPFIFLPLLLLSFLSLLLMPLLHGIFTNMSLCGWQATSSSEVEDFGIAF